MSDPALRAATMELIQGVVALIGTPRDDMRYREKAQSVLGLCEVALKAQASHVEGAADAFNVQTGPAELGIRIARLRAHGMGIRAIARRLGVHASTVSRRLRRAQHLGQHPTLRAEND